MASKFPSQNGTAAFEGQSTDFQQRYLVIPGSALDMIVNPAWIHRYDELPDDKTHPYELVISVDQLFYEEGSDFTAIVTFVSDVNNKFQIYFLPHGRQ